MKLKSEFLREIHSRGFIYQSSDIESLDSDLDNNEDNLEDDTVLLEDETDIDPAVDAGIKPKEDGEEEY